MSVILVSDKNLIVNYEITFYHTNERNQKHPNYCSVLRVLKEGTASANYWLIYRAHTDAIYFSHHKKK